MDGTDPSFAATELNGVLKNAAGHTLRSACNRVVAGVHEHRCATCRHWLPWTPEFFHRKGPRLQSHCKECACEIARGRHIRTARHFVDKRDPADGPVRSFDAEALVSAMRRPPSAEPDACTLRRLSYPR